MTFGKCNICRYIFVDCMIHGNKAYISVSASTRCIPATKYVQFMNQMAPKFLCWLLEKNI